MRRRGRPGGLGHIKVNLSIDKNVVKEAKVEAVIASRSISGFFEMAAKMEIKRLRAERGE